MKIDHNSPLFFGARQWKEIIITIYTATAADQVSLLAAGVAFYALFALFPALAAVTWLFGLLADPTSIQQQLASVRDLLPAEAYNLIENQLITLTNTSARLSLTGVISLLIALYSARLAATSMVQALNAVYKVEETRGFFTMNAIAILCTFLALIIFALAIALLVVMPALFNFIGFPPIVENLVHYLRWPGLAAFVVLTLALTYRYGPDRKKAQWRWVSWGSVTATAIWLIVSFGFSWYVSAFGTYDRIYGSLGAVVILLFWFWLTAFSALLGAELDKAIEVQTAAGPVVEAEKSKLFDAAAPFLFQQSSDWE